MSVAINPRKRLLQSTVKVESSSVTGDPAPPPVEDGVKRQRTPISDVPERPLETREALLGEAALEKTPQNEESASSSDEGDQTLYCTCRKPWDGEELMIQCDQCQAWYYAACMNISNPKAKRIKQWLCEFCDVKPPAKQRKQSQPRDPAKKTKNSRDSALKLRPSASSSTGKDKGAAAKKKSNKKQGTERTGAAAVPKAKIGTSSTPCLNRCCPGFSRLKPKSRFCSDACGRFYARDILVIRGNYRNYLNDLVAARELLGADTASFSSPADLRDLQLVQQSSAAEEQIQRNLQALDVQERALVAYLRTLCIHPQSSTLLERPIQSSIATIQSSTSTSSPHQSPSSPHQSPFSPPLSSSPPSSPPFSLSHSLSRSLSRSTSASGCPSPQEEALQAPSGLPTIDCLICGHSQKHETFLNHVYFCSAKGKREPVGSVLMEGEYDSGGLLSPDLLCSWTYMRMPCDRFRASCSVHFQKRVLAREKEHGLCFGHMRMCGAPQQQAGLGACTAAAKECPRHLYWHHIEFDQIAQERLKQSQLLKHTGCEKDEILLRIFRRQDASSSKSV